MSAEKQLMPLDGSFNRGMKRLFDIFFSLFALCITAPLMLICTIAIKLSSDGPVLFKQERAGLGHTVFECYKLRSMNASVNEEGSVLPWIGKLIRKSDLDEVPQFVNVLKGEMSVVGPRPHTPGDAERFTVVAADYPQRYAVKPGLTGWAQVNGWRGKVDSDQKIMKRTEFDLWYIANWSFRLDLKIIFLTVFSAKARNPTMD